MKLIYSFFLVTLIFSAVDLKASQNNKEPAIKVFEVTPDMANQYGIYSYTLTEETSPYKSSQFSVHSRSANVHFTIIEGSTNGSRRLKSALKNQKNFRKENQSLLFQLGLYLAKAQNTENKMAPRFNDFDVEVERIRKEAQILSGKIPSETYQKLLGLEKAIQDSQNPDFLSAYEEILKLINSKSRDTTINVLFKIVALHESVKRTQGTLANLKKDLLNEQQDFITFSQNFDNNVILQDMKLWNTTIYLRGVATTLHSYINQTQTRIEEAITLESQLPQINTEIVNLIQDVKEAAFAIRSRAISNNPRLLEDILIIEQKYNTYYSPAGALVQVKKTVSIALHTELSKAPNGVIFCKNRICQNLAAHPLLENSKYFYLHHLNSFFIINSDTLFTVILSNKDASDIAKKLYCVGGARKFKQGAGFVADGIQVAGWFIFGGLIESTILNSKRVYNDEPAGFEFTKDMMNQNAKDYEIGTEKYKRMQDIHTLTLNSFLNEFKAPIEEFHTESSWAETLINQSQIQCDQLIP